MTLGSMDCRDPIARACRGAICAILRTTIPDMARGPLDDAAARHLEEVASDILDLLGPGIELMELVREAEASDAVVLRARYRLADESIESVGRGASVIEAHARLREAIVTDRVGLGLRVLL